MSKCIYCNSTNIQADVVVGQTAEPRALGLKYRTNFLIFGVEPFYAELCKDCGSIVRFYLKKTDRNWYTK
jgi:uncharacterized membrane protein (UPF0127 family)